MTKSALEWRIRNLSYPKDVYSVTAEEDETITVRTSNKKYFKKIVVPDLERIGLKPKQENISFSHRFDTLIILVMFYSKKLFQHLCVFKVLISSVTAHRYPEYPSDVKKVYSH